MIDYDEEPYRYFFVSLPQRKFGFFIVLKQYVIGAVPHIINGKPCRTMTKGSSTEPVNTGVMLRSTLLCSFKPC